MGFFEHSNIHIKITPSTPPHARRTLLHCNPPHLSDFSGDLQDSFCGFSCYPASSRDLEINLKNTLLMAGLNGNP